MVSTTPIFCANVTELAVKKTKNIKKTKKGKYIIDENGDMEIAFAYNAVLTEVKNRKVNYRDLAQIAIDTLSDLELYELTAILNKHQKEKYEQEKDILGQ